MNQVRVNLRTLGVACVECVRVLDHREWFWRDYAPTFAPVCKACLPKYLAAKPGKLRGRPIARPCRLCAEPAKNSGYCRECTAVIDAGLARIAPYRLPVPRV